MRNFSVKPEIRRVLASGTVLVVLSVLPALAGPPPAEKCEAAKNKVAGSYYSCLQKAEAKAILSATAPSYSACSSKFTEKWNAAETASSDMCPDTVTTSAMNSYLASHAAEAATVIAGGSIPDCAGDLSSCEADVLACDEDLAACNDDLTACEAQPVGQTHRTGQDTCYNAAGTPVTCFLAWQDGTYFAKGVPVSLTDNGDGTITDNRTGLMWEKLSDDGSIHDKDASYTWTAAISTKINTLKTTNFAGYNDWRLPNIKELETLRYFGVTSPATYSEFHTGCAPACTVLTCSCMRSSVYWSSSSYEGAPANAWVVDYATGSTGHSLKTTTYHVRGVRG